MTHEEQIAHMKESSRVGRLPLEEAGECIDGPLYGLDRPVFGLQHFMHIWQGNDCMRLEYHSPQYAEYAFQNDRTFTITNTIFVDGQDVTFGCRGLKSEAGAILFWNFPTRRGDPQLAMFASKAKSLRLIAKDVALPIDGKTFNGEITHFTDPVRYSCFEFRSGCVGLQGEALGPSIEEVAEILKSLRVLNAKQIVERNKMQ